MSLARSAHLCSVRTAIDSNASGSLAMVTKSIRGAFYPDILFHSMDLQPIDNVSLPNINVCYVLNLPVTLAHLFKTGNS